MRSLGVTYKSAWFMAHRVREAMKVGGLVAPSPMGGEGQVVEADETYHGKVGSPRVSPTRKYRGAPTKGGHSGPAQKRAIVALVERGGSVRTFHAGVADKATINRILDENVARESRLHTDESRLYGDAADKFAKHETRQALGWRICPRRRAYEQRRRLLLNLQARDARHLISTARRSICIGISRNMTSATTIGPSWATAIRPALSSRSRGPKASD